MSIFTNLNCCKKLYKTTSKSISTSCDCVIPEVTHLLRHCQVSISLLSCFLGFQFRPFLDSTHCYLAISLVGYLSVSPKMMLKYHSRISMDQCELTKVVKGSLLILCKKVNDNEYTWHIYHPLPTVTYGYYIQRLNLKEQITS